MDSQPPVPNTIDDDQIDDNDNYKWALNALEVLASTRKFHDIVNKDLDKAELFNATRMLIEKLLTFECQLFMDVDSVDMSFNIARCMPADHQRYMQDIIDDEIESGTFSWALQQNKCVTVEDHNKNKTVVFHSISTPVGVQGMFVGLLDRSIHTIQGIRLDMISVIIRNLASALDTYKSRELTNNYAEQLEVLIKYRTRELEEEKKLSDAANVAKSEFLAGMSHELNTPFNIIFGYLDLLIEDINETPKDDPRKLMLGDIDKITRATKGLHRMVRNIVYLAKLEAGKVSISKDNFVIEETLHQLRQRFSKDILANGNICEVKNNSKHREVFSDQQLIMLALEHLLSNACKFTHDGEINIEVNDSTLRNGTEVIEISVSDTGIGIAEEGLTALFNSFTQIDSGSRKKYDGLGLGLTITNRICDLLKVRLDVSSKENEGARFTIVLSAH